MKARHASGPYIEAHGINVDNYEAVGPSARKKVLTIGHVKFPPFGYMSKNNDVPYGIDLDVWKVIAKKLRVSTKHTLAQAIVATPALVIGH